MPDLQEHLLLDPFAIPEAWRDQLAAPAYIAGEASLFEHPNFDLPSLKPLHATGTYEKSPRLFELPDLAAFRHTALPSLEELPPPSVSSLDDFSEPRSPTFAAFVKSQGRNEELPEDLWQDSSTLPTLKGETRLHTWSSFHNGYTQRLGAPKSGLLSEAGPQAFDAAIEAHARASNPPRQAGRVVQSNALLNSLFELGLGRGSTLFPRNETTNDFEKAVHDGRLSGTSLDVSKSITDRFLDTGNTVLRLRAFADKALRDEQACAGKMALASVVRVALDAVEEHVVYRRKDILSLLQLQHLFELPYELLVMLRELLEKVVPLDTTSAVTCAVFEMMQELEARGHDLEIMQIIFERVSRPWLDELETVVGLRSSMGSLSLTDGSKDLQEQQLANSLPGFLDEGTKALVQETSTCIEHLREHVSDYQLTRSGRMYSDPAGFEWAFSWQDVVRVSTKAEEFEGSLRAALDTTYIDEQRRIPDASATHHPLQASDPWKQIQATDLYSLNTLPTTKISLEHSRLSDELHEMILKHLSSPRTTYKSLSSHLPVDLIPSYSITPLLRIQHRHLTAQVLRSLLHTHNLSHHLHTLGDFHLFGSGIFTTSLSHVLFAPDVESTERQKHVARSGQQGAMGLRLGSGMRREWPPTSSELSLALVGVLESTHSASSTNTKHTQQAFALPTSSEPTTDPLTTTPITSHKPTQTLSFSLRPSLSDSEISRILNPTTIYALDFLTLAFSPPAGLRIIFTEPILEKYDRIFKFLLRSLRVQSVLAQVFAETTGFDLRSGKRRPVKGDVGRSRAEKPLQRFRHRASTFISTLLTYIRHTAISPPWSGLMAFVHELEASTTEDTHTATEYKTAGSGASLTTLQTKHESTLNKILTLLFLRRRQRKISEALEVVLCDILAFASSLTLHNNSISGSADGSTAPSDGGEIKQALEGFEAHIAEFVDALLEAAERAEMGKDGRGYANRGGGDGGDAENERDVVEAFEGLAVLVRWPGGGSG